MSGVFESGDFRILNKLIETKAVFESNTLLLLTKNAANDTAATKNGIDMAKKLENAFKTPILK